MSFGYNRRVNLTKIVHYESTHDASMRAHRDDFVVMTPTGDVDDNASVHVCLTFTDRLLDSLGLTEPKVVTVRMRAALAHIRALIVENALTPGEEYKFMFTSGDPPPMGELKWKECVYQEHAQLGLRCLAAHPRDRAAGVTTTEICEDCQLPSTDLLCDAVTHPVVTGNEEAASLTTRNLVESKCDVGSPEFDEAASCVPHIRSCWHKTIPLEPDVATEPTEDLLDLVDLLNDVFYRKYGVELIRLVKAQTIRVLVEPGSGREAFESKIQALGRLLEHIQGGPLGDSIGAITSNKGSISKLEVFLLALPIPDVPRVIQPLRDVVTVRVALSHDLTKQDVVSACGRLGISLPLGDFDEVWERTVGAVAGALRYLHGEISTLA